eukprot:1392336-Prymnesium_polylepis.1
MASFWRSLAPARDAHAAHGQTADAIERPLSDCQDTPHTAPHFACHVPWSRARVYGPTGYSCTVRRDRAEANVGQPQAPHATREPD